MKIILGYVSLPISIGITSSSTITYQRYKKSNYDKRIIYKIINKNLLSLEKILKFNLKNNIHFYRMSSKLIPLSTIDNINFNYIDPFINEYKKIGKFITENNMRIDMHPDQFCILNSTNKDIKRKSIKILEYHRNLYDAFNIDKPKLILHIGSSVLGKKNSISRFINTFNELDENIKRMICIENDDKVFNIKDVLNLCNLINVPMILDYHHYTCNNEKERLEDYLKDIFSTWKDLPPKVHFSSPKSKLKREFRAHNDYIDVYEFIKFLEMAKNYTDVLYVMIEAKKKDEALFRLVRQLKYLTDYKFIDDTSFTI